MKSFSSSLFVGKSSSCERGICCSVSINKCSIWNMHVCIQEHSLCTVLLHLSLMSYRHLMFLLNYFIRYLLYKSLCAVERSYVYAYFLLIVSKLVVMLILAYFFRNKNTLTSCTI